jgi:hypothetical protein
MIEIKRNLRFGSIEYFILVLIIQGFPTVFIVLIIGLYIESEAKEAPTIQCINKCFNK